MGRLNNKVLVLDLCPRPLKYKLRSSYVSHNLRVSQTDVWGTRESAQLTACASCLWWLMLTPGHSPRWIHQYSIRINSEPRFESSISERRVALVSISGFRPLIFNPTNQYSDYIHVTWSALPNASISNMESIPGRGRINISDRFAVLVVVVGPDRTTPGTNTHTETWTRVTLCTCWVTWPPLCVTLTASPVLHVAITPEGLLHVGVA